MVVVTPEEGGVSFSPTSDVLESVRLGVAQDVEILLVRVPEEGLYLSMLQHRRGPHHTMSLTFLSVALSLEILSTSLRL